MPPAAQLDSPSPSTPLATPLHAFYCFNVLESKLSGKDPIPPPFEDTDTPYALFVTWNTSKSSRSSGKPSLRGCIGTFSPLPLARGLSEYALVSALQDHRFNPIRAAELPYLSCAISILTPFTPISDPLDWIPGKHGIHITFANPSGHGRRLSATYLPEVTPEQGWTNEEAVLSAIQKAGYHRPVSPGDAVWNSLEVKVYSSEKAAASWDEYVEWKASL